MTRLLKIGLISATATSKSRTVATSGTTNTILETKQPRLSNNWSWPVENAMRASAPPCLPDLSQTSLFPTERGIHPNVECQLFPAFQRPNLDGSYKRSFLCVKWSKVGDGSLCRQIRGHHDCFQVMRNHGRFFAWSGYQAPSQSSLSILLVLNSVMVPSSVCTLV